MKNYFKFLGVSLFCVFAASCSSSSDDVMDDISLVNTAWQCTSSHEPDGDDYLMDDVIVFTSSSEYTLYTSENDFKPIYGTYSVNDNKLVMMDSNTKSDGIFSVKNDILTYSYRFTLLEEMDTWRITATYKSINTKDVKSIVNNLIEKYQNIK